MATMDNAVRPTYFEMWSEQQVIPVFREGSRHIVMMLASRFPDKLEWLVQWHEELFAMAVFAVEWHHMGTYSGTFSEVLNGLKRVKESGSDLGGRTKWLAVLVTVGLPYVKTRLEAWYRQAEADFEMRHRRASSSGTEIPERGLAQRLFPSLHLLYESIFFVWQLMYMFGHTDAFTPVLALQRMRVRRRTAEELDALHRDPVRALLDRLRSVFRAPTVPVAVARAAALAVHIALDNAHNTITVLAFVFRLLVGWHRQNRQSQADAQAASSTPPPPAPVPPSPAGLRLPKDPSTCPLCLQPRNNPAASSAGYVYCYPCLFQQVSITPLCPVSRWPCDVDQIRKLYD